MLWKLPIFSFLEKRNASKGVVPLLKMICTWGFILMCDSAPKESIRHPHLWSVGHCQVFYPIWGQAFWIYNYSFDILIFGEQLYKMSSISSLSMSSVLNDISFVLWLKYSVSRHILLLTLALQQIYPFVIDRGNFHTFDYFER